jgi:hypothetical protein
MPEFIDFRLWGLQISECGNHRLWNVGTADFGMLDHRFQNVGPQVLERGDHRDVAVIHLLGVRNMNSHQP